jgi:hypothetical protein
MSEAIPPLPQYTFMAWCLVKAQGQFLPFIKHGHATLFINAAKNHHQQQQQGRPHMACSDSEF